MAGERILVADDSRENREFIIDYILQPNGFQIIEARDGRETLDQIRRQTPDLILLDLQMPRLDGRGVLEEMQRESITIPVILMTFHGSEDIAVEMFRLGVRDYVKKPYTPNEMMAAIDVCLAEVRLRKEKDALTQRLLHANRELHSRVKELNALYTIGKSVTSTLSLSQILARVVEAATVVTTAEQGRLVLIEDGKVITRAIKRHSDEHARPAADPVQDPFVERVLKTEQPMAVSAADLAPQRQKYPSLPNSVALVPLQLRGQTIGVLAVDNVAADSRDFSEHDSAMLSALGDYAAIAIENARQFQQLEATRSSDSMGGVSASGFMKIVPPEQERAAVLIAEVRGFAANGLDSFSLLSDYLTLATEAVNIREGDVFPNASETLVALFAEPTKAISAALALNSGAASLNAIHSVPISFGIGIAMGDVYTGTIGESLTVTGVTATIARRLSELAEDGQVLADGGCAQAASGELRATALGRQKLKGVSSLTDVYAMKL